jgi:hypothetical protein
MNKVELLPKTKVWTGKGRWKIPVRMKWVLKFSFIASKITYYGATEIWGKNSDHETTQTPLFVTNSLFLENMHFKATWGPGIMKEEFKGLKAELVWGEQKNVRFETLK